MTVEDSGKAKELAFLSFVSHSTFACSFGCFLVCLQMFLEV